MTDPPALVFDEPVDPAAGRRAGPRPGPRRGARRREGRWGGLAGLRRFAGGAFLEAGWVSSATSGTVAIPLADLERFG